MKYLYALIILLMALFLAAFITQNSQEIVLKYFHWRTIPLPLSLFMILAFASGYALAVIVGFSTGIRHRVRASGAEREARRLRAEVENIRKEEKTEAPGDTKSGPAREKVPFENDIEEDTYTTVNFPKKEEEGTDLSEGEEEKGER